MKNKAYFLLFTSLILAFNLYWLVEIYNTVDSINTFDDTFSVVWLVSVMFFMSAMSLYIAFDSIFNDPYQIK